MPFLTRKRLRYGAIATSVATAALVAAPVTGASATQPTMAGPATLVTA